MRNLRMRAGRGAGWGAGFLAAFGWLLHGAPSSFFWLDSPELTAQAASLGIAHNPGYPLYPLLAGPFLHFLPFGSQAFRLNVLAGLVTAGAAVLAALIVGRVGSGPLSLGERARVRVPLGVGGAGVPPVMDSALLASLVFLLAPVVVEQGRCAEVYAFHGLFVAALILWSFRPASLQNLLGAVLLTAFAGLNHYAILPLLPGFLVLFSPHLKRLRGKAAWAGVLLGALLPAAVLLYLPLRASRLPAIDYANPSSWTAFSGLVTAQSHRAKSLETPSLKKVEARVREVVAFHGKQADWAFLAAALGLLGLGGVMPRRVRLGCLLLVLGEGGYMTFLNVVPLYAAGFGLPSVVAIAVLAGGAAAGIGEAGWPRKAGGILAIAFLIIQAAFSAREVTRHPPTGRRADEKARLWAQYLSAPLPQGTVVAAYSDGVYFPLIALQVTGRWRDDLQLIPRQSPGFRFNPLPRELEMTVAEACRELGMTLANPEALARFAGSLSKTRPIAIEVKPDDTALADALSPAAGSFFLWKRGIPAWKALPWEDRLPWISERMDRRLPWVAREVFGDSWTNRFLILKAKGSKKDAARAAGVALYSSNGAPLPSLNFGLLVLERGEKHEKARQFFKAALRQRPDWGLAKFHLARSYEPEDMNQAFRLLEEAVTADDPYPPAGADAAAGLHRRGRDEEAVRCLQSALEKGLPWRDVESLAQDVLTGAGREPEWLEWRRRYGE